MDKHTALTTLICVADQNSFSQAALLLGKTPSAVTKIISSLEKDVGASLFERSTRKIQLTEAGHVLVESAREIMLLLEQAGEQIRQLQNQLSGELRIAAPLAFGAAFLNSVSANFSRNHPLIHLQITLSDDDRKILEGGFDLIFHEGECDLPGLISRPIGRNDVVMVASREYISSRPQKVRPDHLHEHLWLVYRHPSLSRRFWYLHKEDETIRFEIPEPKILSDNFDLLLEAALEGAGILHAPLWSVSKHLLTERLILIEPDWKVDPDAFGPHILAVYPSHRRDTKKIHKFIDLVRLKLKAIGADVAIN